jgi:hypothetical protein
MGQPLDVKHRATLTPIRNPRGSKLLRASFASCEIRGGPHSRFKTKNGFFDGRMHSKPQPEEARWFAAYRNQ